MGHLGYTLFLIGLGIVRIIHLIEPGGGGPPTCC